MVDLKRAGERLQSARQWILHAQEAFDNKKDIRGELDLFLAQAELRRVRQDNRSCKWWYRYSLYRQLAALSLAVMMATVGIGGAYWLLNRTSQPSVIPQTVVYHDTAGDQTAKSQPETAQKTVQSAVVQQEHTALPETAAEPPAHRIVVHEDHAAATAAGRDDTPKEKASQSNVVPPDEMQKLVRTAGKSLRGQ